MYRDNEDDMTYGDNHKKSKRGNPKLREDYQKKLEELSDYERNLVLSSNGIKASETRAKNISYKKNLQKAFQSIMQGQVIVNGNQMSVADQYAIRFMAKEMLEPTPQGLKTLAQLNGDLVEKVEVSRVKYEDIVIEISDEDIITIPNKDKEK